MANALSAASAIQLPPRLGVVRPTTQIVPVHPLARLAFWFILVLSVTNAIGVLITVMKRLGDEAYELSIYPIVFAVCLAIVLAFSKPRRKSTLLNVAWVFWLLFFLGGFLGAMQLTGTDVRSTLRVTVKPWITLVGLPWIALRAISEDKVPRLIHATVLLTTLGAVVSLLQVMVPGFMAEVLANMGRAEGLWNNPALSGYISIMVLFLSIVHPFKSVALTWTCRLILLAAVGASLSRGPLLGLFVSWIVYGVTARKFATLFKSLVVMVLFLTTTLVVLEGMQTISKDQEHRVSVIRSLLTGEWDASTFTDRTKIWLPALDAIMSKGGLLVGLGHGSMGNIVATSEGGLAPHNYYIYVLGNSGLLALIALIVLHGALFQQATKVPDRGRRAALFAIATLWAFAHIIEHDLVGHVTLGVVLACMAVVVAYPPGAPVLRRNLMSPVRLRPRLA